MLNLCLKYLHLQVEIVIPTSLGRNYSEDYASFGLADRRKVLETVPGT